MCQQLWLKFASAELALKVTGAFEDAKVLNNVVQEIMPSCEVCLTRRLLECFGYGPGQQECNDDRLNRHYAPRAHRGTEGVDGQIGGAKPTSSRCCAITHVLAVAQLPSAPRKSACSRHDHHFARCLRKGNELIMCGRARTEFNCEVAPAFCGKKVARASSRSQIRLFGVRLLVEDSCCCSVRALLHTRHRGRVRADFSDATPSPHQDMLFKNLRSTRRRCDVQHMGGESRRG